MTLRAKPARAFLVAAAALGTAVRLVFALFYWTSQPLTRDEREYLSLARGVASGRGLVYDADVMSDTHDPFGRAPGYPLFLALVGGGRASASAVPVSVKVAQSVLGGLGVVMVGMWAGRLAGAPAARAAALAAAVYPPLVWIASYAFSEALAWPLGIAAAWLFDRALDAPERVAGRTGVASGAFIGLVVLVRPAALFFLVLAAAWLVWRRQARVLLAFVAGALIVIAPWTIRNYRNYHRFVLVASEGGVTFWTGNHPLAIGDGDLAANLDLKRASQTLRAAHPDLNEEQMEPIYYREALAWIGTHPSDWLRLEARKAYYLAVPVGPSYRVHSTRYYAASAVSYGLLLPIAVAGFVNLGPARRQARGLWLLAGSAVVTCLVFFSQERFRIPVIDPVLIVCASGVLAPRPATSNGA